VGPAGVLAGHASANRFQLVRLKSKGLRLALVQNVALRVDQVNAVGPARIGLFGRIAELVEHGWKLNPKFPYAGPSDERAIFFSFRARKDNAGN
jgi:hypothetical protein